VFFFLQHCAGGRARRRFLYRSRERHHLGQPLLHAVPRCQPRHWAQVWCARLCCCFCLLLSILPAQGLLMQLLFSTHPAGAITLPVAHGLRVAGCLHFTSVVCHSTTVQEAIGRCWQISVSGQGNQSPQSSSAVQPSSRHGAGPPAMSAASSACDHIRDWVCGTPCRHLGQHGGDPRWQLWPAGRTDLQLPCDCKDGTWSIVQVRFADMGTGI